MRPGFGIPKALFTIFYTALGPVLVDMMPRRQNMNGRTYGRKILSRVFTGLRDLKPGRALSRWHLHHDNASPHKTLLVKNVLEGARIHILEHAPYSPDLAPCDFYLFPTLKTRLAGRTFKTRPAFAKAVNEELKSIPLLDYRNSFDSWLKRCERCMKVKGDYFEGV